VEGEKIRLESNFVDGPDDLTDVLRGFLDAADRFNVLANDFAALLGIRFGRRGSNIIRCRGALGRRIYPAIRRRFIWSKLPRSNLRAKGRWSCSSSLARHARADGKGATFGDGALVRSCGAFLRSPRIANSRETRNRCRTCRDLTSPSTFSGAWPRNWTSLRDWLMICTRSSSAPHGWTEPRTMSSCDRPKASTFCSKDWLNFPIS